MNRNLLVGAGALAAVLLVVLMSALFTVHQTQQALVLQFGNPKRIITDKLASYGAARRQVMPRVEHRSHKGLNNRAENSHVPLRKRERMMQGFRSAGGLQRFTSVFSAMRNLFVPAGSRRSALVTHLCRLQAMTAWKAAAGVLA